MTTRAEQIAEVLRKQGLTGMALNKEVKRRIAAYSSIKDTEGFKEMQRDNRRVKSDRRKRERLHRKEQDEFIKHNQRTLPEYD